MIPGSVWLRWRRASIEDDIWSVGGESTTHMAPYQQGFIKLCEMLQGKQSSVCIKTAQDTQVTLKDAFSQRLSIVQASLVAPNRSYSSLHRMASV